MSRSEPILEFARQVPWVHRSARKFRRRRWSPGRGSCQLQPYILPLFTQVPGETVWKFGVGPELGLREQSRGVE